MGFKKFFSKEDEEKEVIEEQTETDEVFAVSDDVSPTLIKQEKGTIVGVFDDAIYDKLTNAVTEQDLPGDDYLEFKASLKKLEVYIPDESKLYKATFDSLNLTVELLLKSVSHYINVVSGEKEKFKIGLQGAVENQVGKKEIELQEIVDKRAGLKTRIEEIEVEIAGLNDYENSLSTELQQAKTKLMLTDANFTVTADELVRRLTGDRSKIEKYLLEVIK